MIFNDLLLTGQLGTYVADLNEQAQNRLQRIIRQKQEAENVTDELKEKDQMAWLRAMNSIICDTHWLILANFLIRQVIGSILKIF